MKRCWILFFRIAVTLFDEENPIICYFIFWQHKPFEYRTKGRTTNIFVSWKEKPRLSFMCEWVWYVVEWFYYHYHENCSEGVKIGRLERLALDVLFPFIKCDVIRTEINGWWLDSFPLQQRKKNTIFGSFTKSMSIFAQTTTEKVVLTQSSELLTMTKTAQHQIPFTFNMSGNPVDLSICVLCFSCSSYKCVVPTLFHSKQLFNNTAGSTGKRINYYVENGENVNLHSEITVGVSMSNILYCIYSNRALWAP